MVSESEIWGVCISNTINLNNNINISMEYCLLGTSKFDMFYIVCVEQWLWKISSMIKTSLYFNNSQISDKILGPYF